MAAAYPGMRVVPPSWGELRRDGKWIVARTTLADVLRAAGVSLPPNV